MSTSDSGRGGIDMEGVLAHPLRIEILCDLIRKGPMSPAAFLRAHNMNRGSIGQVTYHFRVLERHNAVLLKDQVQRNGTWEHIFAVDPNMPGEAMLDWAAAARNLLDQGDGRIDGKSGIQVVHLTVDRRGAEEVDQATREFRDRLERVEKTNFSRLSRTGVASQHVQVLFTGATSNAAG